MAFPWAVGSFDEDLAVAHEGRLHDARGERLVAHHHLDRVAGPGFEGQARERDRLAERGREGAAGDLALAVRGADFLVGAQYSPRLDQDQPQELVPLAARGQRLPADEVARALELDGPREARVEGRDVV